MNSNKELLRNAILIQLEASYPASLPLHTILQGISLAGLHPNKSTINKDLSYLQEKSLISSSPHPLAKSSIKYKLTASGKDYLEKQGLA